MGVNGSGGCFCHYEITFEEFCEFLKKYKGSRTATPFTPILPTLPESPVPRCTTADCLSLDGFFEQEGQVFCSSCEMPIPYMTSPSPPSSTPMPLPLGLRRASTSSSSSSSSYSSCLSLTVGVDILIPFNRALQSGREFLYTHPLPVAAKVLNEFQPFYNMGFKFLYVVDSSSAVSPKLVGFQRRAERSFHHLNSKYALLRYAATPTEKSLKTEALSSLRKSLKPSREMLEIFRSKLDPTHANYFESAFQADSQMVHFFNTGIIDAIVS